MHYFVCSLIVCSLSWLSYLEFRPVRKTLAQRIADLNANFGTDFVCGPLLGSEWHGFLLDVKNRKVSYFRGAEGELLDFDYFKSWAVAPGPEPALLFLTTERSRPVIRIDLQTRAELRDWLPLLETILPPVIPETTAA